MPVQPEASAVAWSARLTAELAANDKTAKDLVAGLTDEQLNWQPVPGTWSIGQCLEHLCAANEVYLPPISVALRAKPRSPVEQICLGVLGDWFIRNFIEPSTNGKRAQAPRKIKPGLQADLSVLDRFLNGNAAWRHLIQAASENDVNHIRFWNPFIPGLRFRVGTGFQIIASHERRHLLQAKRVRESSEFPH